MDAPGPAKQGSDSDAFHIPITREGFPKTTEYVFAVGRRILRLNN